MKSQLKIFTVLLIGVLALKAQAQIEVNTSIINNRLEVFFLSDFDINSPTVGPVIFAIEIINEDPVPKQVELTLEIIKEPSDPLSSGRSGVFTLTPNQHLRLTNQNLFSSLDPYRLIEYSLHGAGQDLLDDVLTTGQLPSGTYTFAVEIIETESGLRFPANDDIDIVVTNPNTLDLIYPGDAVQSGAADCLEVFSNLPQFRWESDFSRFRVIIAEARPGGDPEDALTQDPRFERIFEVGINIPSTSFQYPSSGELLTLRPGGTYYWRVVGLVETSSGEVEIPSEIYCFRIADVNQLGTTNQEIELIVPRILRSLGINVDQLFGPGGELRGYKANGISFDGKQMSIPEFIGKINELRANYSRYRVEN